MGFLERLARRLVGCGLDAKLIPLDDPKVGAEPLLADTMVVPSFSCALSKPLRSSHSASSHHNSPFGERNMPSTTSTSPPFVLVELDPLLSDLFDFRRPILLLPDDGRVISQRTPVCLACFFATREMLVDIEPPSRS